MKNSTRCHPVATAILAAALLGGCSGDNPPELPAELACQVAREDAVLPPVTYLREHLGADVLADRVADQTLFTGVERIDVRVVQLRGHRLHRLGGEQPVHGQPAALDFRGQGVPAGLQVLFAAFLGEPLPDLGLGAQQRRSRPARGCCPPGSR